MPDAQQEAADILRSWQQIEFFQPYSLPDERKPPSRVFITVQELTTRGNALFPWLSAGACRQLGITSGKAVYTLYLGLFDKSLISHITDQRIAGELSELDKTDLEERLDQEGPTCFAKLQLDKHGTPDFEGISVSTLPWALGQFMRGQEDQLTAAAFNSRCDLLSEALMRLVSHLPAHPDEPEHCTLDANTLLILLNQLEQWAAFSPSEIKGTPPPSFAFALDWRELPDKKRIAGKTAAKEQDITDDPEEEESGGADQERKIPILNSFYIDDLEQAIRLLHTGRGNRTLLTYLTPHVQKHADLYSRDGLPLIISRLAPAGTPAGRWPSEPAYNMSLMQQFAINTAVHELQAGGLLSVNGPPGTGKTTLLRDIIAHNLVERAAVLATLNTAADALDKQGQLIPALTGFEMVVASSNNAAVENISRELPLVKTLGEAFRTLDYLKPVANQLNAKSAKRRNKQGEEEEYLLPLAPEAQCWGTISAVLGKKSNRTKFSWRLAGHTHHKENSEQERERPGAEDFLRIWRWKPLHQGPGFSAAKKAYLEKRRQVDDRLAYLQQMSELADYLRTTPREAFLAAARQHHADAQRSERQAQQALTARQAALQQHDEESELVVLEIKQQELRQPGFFSRLFDRRGTREYRAKLAALVEQQLSLKKARRPLQQTLSAAQSAHTRCREQLQSLAGTLEEQQRQYDLRRTTLTAFTSQHPDLSLPTGDDITDPALQRNAFWQDKTINTLRSELFVAAMELHQAWLYEAWPTKQIYGMGELMKGNSQAPLPLWQLLFMIVPVISTTFASLGRMFHGVDQDALGWLLIDEAGQAIPQAAVGGLMRSRRALVVGDPLQIEPVFTTPPKLVNYLSERMLHERSDAWNPSRWSIQQLADRVNPYGCTLPVMGTDQPVWIGIPLWVHRRCIEPMFSLANQIAYDNRMIHGAPPERIAPQLHPVLGANHWQVSQGSCTYRQYKAQLGEQTLAMLAALVQQGQKLEQVYVITPFKAVKNKLHELLAPCASRFGMNTKTFHAWLSTHVGTVHTFQGKENHTVILVLGCDPDNDGGAVWASGKPNLLNVALTRAQKNIFIIGDPDVWLNKPYFNRLGAALPQQKAR
ncbi:helicase [Nissabacter archeti]|uniref:Helicase n=1 Tax=Nissabacter archeti TaxID=1917880 RepID=A0ABS5JNC8_9GAMM|nr:ATP-binding protein [Nissabacter archeti]MBS0971415.1 helicase [Nissabacter archeti]